MSHLSRGESPDKCGHEDTHDVTAGVGPNRHTPRALTGMKKSVCGGGGREVWMGVEMWCGMSSGFEWELRCGVACQVVRSPRQMVRPKVIRSRRHSEDTRPLTVDEGEGIGKEDNGHDQALADACPDAQLDTDLRGWGIAGMGKAKAKLRK